MTDRIQNTPNVAFIGYGEAARAFAKGWRAGGLGAISAFDLKTGVADQRDAQWAIYDADGTQGYEKDKEAIESGQVVFSMVTADQALVAATSAAKRDLDGRFFFDCNSCAPQTKQASRDVIEAAGGRYVDVAVMAPVHPKLNATPVLISGPHVEEALDVMVSLDMSAKLADGPVGTASSIKLCRSIIVKGLEAISAEMILTARTLGVEAPVLASLDASYPGYDWPKRTSYAMDRMMIHGGRRSEEMREAAVMVENADLPADMSKAIVEWHRRIGAIGLDPGADDLEVRAEKLLSALSSVT